MDNKQQSKKNAPTALKKAVKNINKLIGVGDISVKTGVSAKYNKPNAKPKLSKPTTPNKTDKTARLYPDRGVVYLAHIPHGFYEEEMKGFFGQFGHITRIRLVRSHKTGNSRGYAFLEFRFKEVAQVVAETMNNYLMGNRLLKAVYIAPEKHTPKMFAHALKYGPETCIGVRRRRESISQQNKPLTAEEAQVRVDKNKHHLLELQEKLKAQGVDCLFQVDDGSSKRLLEESNSLPPSKRACNSSPAPKAKTSKPTEVKQSIQAQTLKKKASTSKGQISQKSVKSIKTEKGSKKAGAVVEKVAVEKTSVKKPVVKKVAKKVVKKTTVAKVGTAKKDVAKKSAAKKQVAKKK